MRGHDGPDNGGTGKRKGLRLRNRAAYGEYSISALYQGKMKFTSGYPLQSGPNELSLSNDLTNVTNHAPEICLSPLIWHRERSTFSIFTR